ncbi:protein-lysine N-methyltransferase EEF2KMT-like isoform X2 [Oncorhynchus kisutch]|uniref:protein-lysine N-methyltransferase EEF2KMT-like isoform X2 n=1 Tax=Oncorhynchus kisutch TaxID=8019 RepID=UPI0012DC6906|nr:protein-lysine N-methyltransferase EEF2KMT-like isoform X2 [Oncorhynchus kisutch]
MYLSKDQTEKTEVTCIRNRADVIYDFKVSFFTMGQLPNFPWNLLERELENDSSSELILDILKQTCLHPLCCKHPPSHEASGREPLDELYDALGEVLGVEEGTECYKSYLLPCGEAVSLSESTAVISEGTTGLVTWEAALYLAEWALENTHLFTDRLVHYCVCSVIVFCLENTHLFTDRLVHYCVCSVIVFCLENTHLFTDRLVHYCVCYVIVFCLQLMLWLLLVISRCVFIVSVLSLCVCVLSLCVSSPCVCVLSLCVCPLPVCVCESVLSLLSYRTVLELGSGVGLTGIAVCRSCSPSSYVFSDCHLSVLHRLRDNVQLNGLDNQNSPRVSVEHLDWEEVTEKQLREIGAATVIAADIVYDPDIIGCLVKLLSKILRCSANGSPPDVYITSTIRNPDTYNSFKHQLESSGIQHEVMTGPVTHVFFYNRQATIEMIKLYI